MISYNTSGGDMNKVTLKQWQMFLAVVKCGSFAQASEQVYRSTSSVHHSVTKLEESLNVNLLKVDGKRTRLTSHGKKVYCLVEKLLTDANNLESYIAGLSCIKDSEIKIAIDGLFPANTLKSVLRSAFNESNRQQLQDTKILTTTIDDKHDSDVVISLFSSPIAGFKVKSVVSIIYTAVTSTTNPTFNISNSIKFSDLHEHIEIKVDVRYSESIENASIDNPCLKFNNLSSVIKTVCDGIGYAWLPLSEIQHLIDEGKLHKISFSDQPNLREVDFYLKVRENLHLKPGVANIVQKFKYLHSDNHIENMTSGKFHHGIGINSGERSVLISN